MEFEINLQLFSGHGGYSKISASGSGAEVIRLDNGAIINLKDMPLKYGRRDKTISDKQRKELDKFGREHRDKDVEHVIFLDDKGNVIGKTRGKKDSVSVSHEDSLMATVTSHNHPRENDNILGGTFTVGETIIENGRTKVKGDLAGLEYYGNQRTKIANAKEGDYVFTKKKDTDMHGLVVAGHKKEVELQTRLRNEVDSAYTLYQRKSISFGEYKNRVIRANNKMLVEMHNWFLDNRKKYRYNYTLEKRK